MSTHVVVRTTTNDLEPALNELERDGRTPYTVQWLGGRDWLIIARENTATSCPTSTGGACQCPNAEHGWVADQDRRHARFDATDLANGPPDITPSAFVNLIDPEVEWGDIKYGRYDTNRVPTGRNFVGWIEDRARSWIIFLGPHGAPTLYWPRRDEAGGVIGEPIHLPG